MGSFASKASRLAGPAATKRKYPQRDPSPAAPPQSARATPTSSSFSSPAPGPTVHPNLQASASKTEGIISSLSSSLLPFPSSSHQNRKFQKAKYIHQQSISTPPTRPLPSPSVPSVPSPLPPPSQTPPLSTTTNSNNSNLAPPHLPPIKTNAHPPPPTCNSPLMPPTPRCKSSPRAPASPRKRSANSPARGARHQARTARGDGSWM